MSGICFVGGEFNNLHKKDICSCKCIKSLTTIVSKLINRSPEGDIFSEDAYEVRCKVQLMYKIGEVWQIKILASNKEVIGNFCTNTPAYLEHISNEELFEI